MGFLVSLSGTLEGDKHLEVEGSLDFARSELTWELKSVSPRVGSEALGIAGAAKGGRNGGGGESGEGGRVGVAFRKRCILFNSSVLFVAFRSCFVELLLYTSFL